MMPYTSVTPIHQDTLVRFSLKRNDVVNHFAARASHHRTKADDVARAAEEARAKDPKNPTLLLEILGMDNTMGLMAYGRSDVDNLARSIEAKVRFHQTKASSFDFFAAHLAPSSDVSLTLDDLLIYEFVEHSQSGPAGLIG